MSMFPIATQKVTTTGVANIQFSSIPQTFTHLQFRVFAASAGSSADNFTIYGFDGTAGSSNAAIHTLYGNGSAVFSSGSTAQYNPALTQIPGTSATSTFGNIVIDILDYTNTNKYKTVRSVGGYDANGSGYIALTSVLPYGFGSSTALSNLWFYTANNFAVGTRVDLYGISTSSVTGA